MSQQPYNEVVIGYIALLFYAQLVFWVLLMARAYLLDLRIKMYSPFFLFLSVIL